MPTLLQGEGKELTLFPSRVGTITSERTSVRVGRHSRLDVEWWALRGTLRVNRKKAHSTYNGCSVCRVRLCKNCTITSNNNVECTTVWCNKMVSGRQRAACYWQRLGSDKRTWPTQWWLFGRHFEVMTSKWMHFEEAFFYAGELIYMWGTCVWDSRESRVKQGRRKQFLIGEAR